MLFFATGATWAALGSDFTMGRLHHRGYRSAIWIPTTLYAAMVIVLLVTVQFMPSVWLTRTLCFLIGASLFTCILGTLQTSIIWLDNRLPTNDPSFRVTLGVLLISLSLILTSFLSWLGDRMYYTNRNVAYWVRINMGGTVVVALLSALMQTCLVRKKQAVPLGD